MVCPNAPSSSWAVADAACVHTGQLAVTPEPVEVKGGEVQAAPVQEPRRSPALNDAA